ncbi:MAG TPA: rhodanese-like domain-containing protein [Acidimicrobiales bacterium]|jgi:rhodanese-related sulfurtransferase|nr:rhodanese-like domain-containing protein [Acidimicrobiales bacterium]
MSETGDVPQIEPPEADARVAAGAYLLDVREPDEWQAGHAPAAHHVPMGEVAASTDQLPDGVDIVVICRSGGRSQKVAEFLRTQGYDASNLAGGMRAWAASGRSVVTDDGTAGAVI